MNNILVFLVFSFFIVETSGHLFIQQMKRLLKLFQNLIKKCKIRQWITFITKSLTVVLDISTQILMNDSATRNTRFKYYIMM
jgi:hypothetical protein